MTTRSLPPSSRMKTSTAAMLAACVVACGETAPGEGVFVPRNGGIEGRLGASHVYLETSAGGVLKLVGGTWPELTTIARIEPVFSVRVPGAAAPLEVRQGFDRAPSIVFLEEGHERLGIRSRFALYDAANGYRGHGFTEVWVYANGEIFVACAASFEGLSTAYAEEAAPPRRFAKVGGAIQAAVPTDPAQRTAVVAGAVRIEGATPGEWPATAQLVPFDQDHLPGRQLRVDTGSGTPVGVYWRTGRMVYNDYLVRPEGGSPTYYQWPVFLRQAYGGYGIKRAAIAPNALRLDWFDDGFEPSPEPEFLAVFRLMAGAAEADVAARVEAEREPVTLGVEGGAVLGNLNGYNDQEAVYHVRKAADPLRITVPGTAPGGLVRLKIVHLRGHGAVTATLDGQPVALQLSAEGGIADDPLAPIREAPEGPADMAVVTVPVTGADRVLELREQPGVQLVYQRKDPWRNVACFTSHGDGRYAAFRFSLQDGVLRNMRNYGQREWALTENLMHWFFYCGFTPEHLLNQMRAFQIVDNGPAGAAFRYVSRNATGGAESEFIVGVPDSPLGMQIDVKARFTVLTNWPYPNVQFFDVFPFRGVWPQDWWYDEVLWVAPDGRVKWMRTLDRTMHGDKDLETLAGPLFVALHAADRGNMVMLTKSFEPALPVSYVICGNYVDFHMTTKFSGPDGKPAAPRPGDSVSMEYELALWGDGQVTRDRLIELGRESLRLGHLTLKEK